ncbi:hypothetical protein AGMMS49990_00940 [Endomicrobiia bacterium]|nr:hypothetical protein AGMMS49990_00940 [Endomicrobiia bacterium]
MKGLKKTKIYLDTSVISLLDQLESPKRRAETCELWKKIENKEFDVVISTVTMSEILRNVPEKKEKLLSYLKEIEYSLVEIDKRSIAVAYRFIDLGILKKRNFNDCQHIAVAIVSGADIIVSWNFKHVVNDKTISGVKVVADLEGYKGILIYTPSILTGEQE